MLQDHVLDGFDSNDKINGCRRVAISIRCRLLSERAFTLIELLVVISIISLLMGILLPALSQAKERGRSVVCLSNIRQTTLAATMYIEDDSHNRFPYSSFPVLSENMELVDPYDSWVYTMKPYVDAHVIAVCPSDESPHWELEKPGLVGRLREVSYGINSIASNVSDMVGLWPPTEAFLGNFNQIIVPSNVIMFGELTETRLAAVGDCISAATWVCPLVENTDEKLDAGFSRHVEAARHTNRPQWGFLDGHAESHTREEVFDLGTYDPSDATGQWAANKFHPSIAR
jgi:prepilin-type N-terminal cleavage/methylation domain-containing protein/prepilin-type processing-associated H-X9-DG protein